MARWQGWLVVWQVVVVKVAAEMVAVARVVAARVAAAWVVEARAEVEAEAGAAVGVLLVAAVTEGAVGVLEASLQVYAVGWTGRA
jgi:hypothetical protein